MEQYEQDLLNQIQGLVDNGSFKDQKDIDVFLDVFGAYNRSVRIALRMSNMIEYCLKKKNEGIELTFEQYIDSKYGSSGDEKARNRA